MSQTSISLVEQGPSSSFSSTSTTQTTRSIHSSTSNSSSSFHQLSQNSRNRFFKTTTATLPSIPRPVTGNPRVPKRYRVSGLTRSGLLHTLRHIPCNDIVVYQGPPDIDCVIVGVGRGYGDAVGNVEFIEHGLARIFSTIARGLTVEMVGGLEALEGLMEKAWVDASCWVNEDAGAWNKGFGGVVGVLWRGFWCLGGLGKGKAVMVGVAGKNGAFGRAKGKGEWMGWNVGDMHDVWNMKERDRIEKFGGLVEGSRVTDGLGGGLEVTRCCGCMRFRSCGVVAVPWIEGGVLGKSDRCLVLSSIPVVGKDGAEKGVEILRGDARNRKGGSDVCRRLLDAAEGDMPKMQDMAVLCVQMFW